MKALVVLKNMLWVLGISSVIVGSVMYADENRNSKPIVSQDESK